MVSALVSGSSGPGSSPGRGHCVVFLGKTLYSHSASLHPVDLPQVDLMKFRAEFVRPQSDKVARGRLVSLEGFSFSFRTKNEEWRDLQLWLRLPLEVLELNGKNYRFHSDQNNRMCVRF